MRAILALVLKMGWLAIITRVFAGRVFMLTIAYWLKSVQDSVGSHVSLNFKCQFFASIRGQAFDECGMGERPIARNGGWRFFQINVEECCNQAFGHAVGLKFGGYLPGFGGKLCALIV